MELPQQQQTARPVTVNDHGESLRIYTGEKRGEQTPVANLYHTLCTGRVEQIPVSAGYFALVCKDCALRIVLPGAIKTLADLRAHFEALLDLRRT